MIDRVPLALTDADPEVVDERVPLKLGEVEAELVDERVALEEGDEVMDPVFLAVPVELLD